jgi:phage baseplate assembly protein W
MAIVQGTRRINPLDLNKNVTIGVAFPINETNLFQGTETMKETIKSNLINLLLTYPGERVNEPTFGVGLKNLLFEQDLDLESLQLKIQNQINQFVPNIILQDVSTGLSEDEHTLFISLVYSYSLDNTLDSIQLNFRD